MKLGEKIDRLTERIRETQTLIREWKDGYETSTKQYARENEVVLKYGKNGQEDMDGWMDKEKRKKKSGGLKF